MKEKELRERSKCSNCEKGVMHSGIPMFWTITIKRHAIKPEAIKRQAGLEMMCGNVALAQVFGSDEEMTKEMMDPQTLTFCETCMIEQHTMIMTKALENSE